MHCYNDPPFSWFRAQALSVLCTVPAKLLCVCTCCISLIGLLYMAFPDGCRHTILIPAEVEALPHEGASALVFCIPFLVFNQRLVQVDVTHLWTAVAAAIVAFSFIFKSAIATMFDSVIFLFVVHAFDVGDGILINGDLHKVSLP